jgi:hypothetical protein
LALASIGDLEYLEPTDAAVKFGELGRISMEERHDYRDKRAHSRQIAS